MLLGKNHHDCPFLPRCLSPHLQSSAIPDRFHCPLRRRHRVDTGSEGPAGQLTLKRYQVTKGCMNHSTQIVSVDRNFTEEGAKGTSQLHRRIGQASHGPNSKSLQSHQLEAYHKKRQVIRSAVSSCQRFVSFPSRVVSLPPTYGHPCKRRSNIWRNLFMTSWFVDLSSNFCSAYE